jgi:hypothetical protein
MSSRTCRSVVWITTPLLLKHNVFMQHSGPYPPTSRMSESGGNNAAILSFLKD